MNKERKMSLWLETIKLNRRSGEMFLAIILRRNKEQHLTCIDTEKCRQFLDHQPAENTQSRTRNRNIQVKNCNNCSGQIGPGGILCPFWRKNNLLYFLFFFFLLKIISWYWKVVKCWRLRQARIGDLHDLLEDSLARTESTTFWKKTESTTWKKS